MLPVPQRNTASTATDPNFDLLVERVLVAGAALRWDEEAQLKSCHPDQSSGRSFLKNGRAGALEGRVGIEDIDSLALYEDTAGEVEVIRLGKPALRPCGAAARKDRRPQTKFADAVTLS